MSTHKYTLFADYFQFYLRDEFADGDWSDSWTEQTVADLLAIAPGTIVIGTVRNMNVPVEVEVCKTEPLDDLEQWDHITECRIDVPSGRLIVAGCMDSVSDAARIEVAPGSYRARIYYGSLDTLNYNGLEGDDHYKVILWPGKDLSTRVIKRYAIK